MVSVTSKSLYHILRITEPKLDSLNTSIVKTECISKLTISNKHLIIDLTNVTFIDSSGLSTILLAHRRAKESNRYCLICNLQPTPTKMIKIAHLDTVLLIFPTIQEAEQFLMDLQ